MKFYLSSPHKFLKERCRNYVYSYTGSANESLCVIVVYTDIWRETTRSRGVYWSQDSLTGITTGRTADESGLNSRQGQEIVLFSVTLTASHLVGVKAVSSVVKQPRREADQSPPSSSEVKNCEAVPPLPHTSS
jgi:hypothetical protein